MEVSCYESCTYVGHTHQKKATDKTSRDKTFARQNLLSIFHCTREWNTALNEPYLQWFVTSKFGCVIFNSLLTFLWILVSFWLVDLSGQAFCSHDVLQDELHSKVTYVLPLLTSWKVCSLPSYMHEKYQESQQQLSWPIALYLELIPTHLGSIVKAFWYVP